MTAQFGIGMFFVGITATIICFYVAMVILPKYFNDKEEKPEKLWWEEKD